MPQFVLTACRNAVILTSDYKLMPLDTLVPQGKPEQRRFQLFVAPDAYVRIRVEAAKRDTTPGEVVSDLAVRFLPPVDGVTVPEEATDAA